MSLVATTARIEQLEAAVANLLRQVAQLNARTAQVGDPLLLAIGKLDTSLAAGASATVSIWRTTPGGAGGAEVDTGKNIADVRDWLMGTCSGRALVSGTRVVIAKIFGTWYVIGAGCC